MQQRTALITGAAGTLGGALADALRAQAPELDLELADINAEALAAIARRTGAVRVIAGDLFDPQAEAYRAVTESPADVMVWNAATNLDRHEPAEERRALRERQNAALARRVQTLEEGNGAMKRRLLVAVNSVAALFGEQLPFAKSAAETNNWQYGLMKGDQSALLREHRAALEAAGTDLAVLYPGSFRSGFTDVEEALRNANGFGKKVRGFRGRPDLRQQRVLEPREIADAVAAAVAAWHRGGALSGRAKEWIMLNAEDL